MSSSLGVAKIYNPKVDSANVALIRKKVYNYIRPGMMRGLGGGGGSRATLSSGSGSSCFCRD